MSKKIRRKTLLRHTRIQSFCAVAGLVLVFVNAPEIIAKTTSIISVITTSLPIATTTIKPSSPVQEINFVELPNGTKISDKMISKKAYLEYLSENDQDTDLPELTGSLLLPAHNIDWALASDICGWIGDKNQLPAVALPSHHDWTAANEAGFLKDTNSKNHEWLGNKGCGDSEQHCEFRMVAGGTMSTWNIHDSSSATLNFRCAQMPSNERQITNKQGLAEGEFRIKQMIRDFFTLTVAVQ